MCAAPLDVRQLCVAYNWQLAEEMPSSSVKFALTDDWNKLVNMF